MKKLNKLFIAVTYMLVLNACNLVNDFVYEKQVIGRYHLIAADSYSELSLSYETDNGGYVGVTPKTTVAFWHDNKYIIIKNYGNNNKFLEKFYIVPVKYGYTYFPEEGVVGPLAKDEFLIKLKELNIPSDIKLKAVR